jgi:hypothetical protein
MILKVFSCCKLTLRSDTILFGRLVLTFQRIILLLCLGCYRNGNIRSWCHGYAEVSEYRAVNVNDRKSHAGEKLVIVSFYFHQYMMMFGCRLHQGPGEHRAKPGESPPSSSPSWPGEFCW